MVISREEAVALLQTLKSKSILIANTLTGRKCSKIRRSRIILRSRKLGYLSILTQPKICSRIEVAGKGASDERRRSFWRGTPNSVLPMPSTPMPKRR
jgi:hypothetical protein